MLKKTWLATRRPQRKRDRRLLLEALESRMMLNVDWRNPADSYDVSADAFITPLDALLVINELNTNGSRELAFLYAAGAPYFDVNGDSHVAPLDVLLEPIRKVI